MSEPNPIQTDVRHAKRTKRLGDNAACVLCGEQELAALIAVSKKFLEDHHIVGRANDPDLVAPLCLNCHRKITEKMDVHGVPLTTPRSCLEAMVAILRGLATLISMLGDKLFRWADIVANLVRGLDRDYPAWRTMPEAQWLLS